MIAVDHCSLFSEISDSNVAWWYFNNAMAMALATDNTAVAADLAKGLNDLVNVTIDPDGSMPKELLYVPW